MKTLFGKSKALYTSFTIPVVSVVVGMFCYYKKNKKTPMCTNSKPLCFIKGGTLVPSPGQLLGQADQTQTPGPAGLSFLRTVHTVIKSRDLGSGQPTRKSQFFGLAG